MKKLAFPLFALLLLAAPAAFAAEFGVTPTAGTLGFGAGLDVRVSPAFGVRLLGHTGTLNHDVHEEDVQFNGKAKFNNFGAIADLYPGSSSFRISAGVFSNNNKIDLRSTEEGTITINGVAYPTSQVGYLTGDVKFNKTSPYVGLGWGRPMGRRWGLTFDLGALYQGSPKLSVTPHPTDPALVPPEFYTNLEAERAKTEEDISNYKYLPVVAIGLSFKF